MSEPEPNPPHVEPEPLAGPRLAWSKHPELARWSRRLGVLTTLAAVAFLGLRLHGELVTLLSARGADRVAQLGVGGLDATIPKLIAASVACLASFSLAVLNWSNLLPAPERITLPRLGVIYGYTLVTKYLPGGVFQYLFGVRVAERLGLRKSTMVQLFLRDSLLAIPTGVALAALSLLGPARAWGTRALDQHGPRWIISLLVFAALLGSLFVLGSRFAVFAKLRAAGRNLLDLSPRVLGAAVLLNALHFFAHGVAARQLAELWAPEPLAPLPSSFSLSCGFALAWLVGLLVPGAPSGLGVREVLLTSLFASSLGEARAILSFVSLRVVSCACELLFFAPAPWLERRYRVLQKPLDKP
ncbi:MAG TPA: hypothetical protein VFQ61_22930 [Polyangiaceae bacterium]|nr:hypothetical protein [Polyangiaceae bacterium]